MERGWVWQRRRRASSARPPKAEAPRMRSNGGQHCATGSGTSVVTCSGSWLQILWQVEGKRLKEK